MSSRSWPTSVLPPQRDGEAEGARRGGGASARGEAPHAGSHEVHDVRSGPPDGRCACPADVHDPSEEREEQHHRVRRAQVGRQGHGPRGEAGRGCGVKDNNDVTYVSLVPGKHKVEVAYEEKPLKRSLAHVMINPAQADAAHCYADGEGVEKTDAGKPVEFTIHACNKVGAEVPLTGCRSRSRTRRAGRRNRRSLTGTTGSTMSSTR